VAHAAIACQVTIGQRFSVEHEAVVVDRIEAETRPRTPTIKPEVLWDWSKKTSVPLLASE
jgi:hypothetical protein